MPKQKITKEMVVDAAFDIARTQGTDQILVRNIANKLGCSVQPIYSYCNNMESLYRDVEEKAAGFIKEYLSSHIDKNNFFQSTGRAYIQLAKEEPHIFKLFILRKRKTIHSLEDLYEQETDPQVARFISDDLDIALSKAKELHLNMLIYTVGIGTILATAEPDILTDEILIRQETAYRAFLKQALEDTEKTDGKKSKTSHE